MQYNKILLKAGIILLCLFLGVLLLFVLGINNNNDIENKIEESAATIVTEKMLVVGGHSVGVRMDVKGVLIVGLEEIETESGEYMNPGLAAGLDIGDAILEVNDVLVYRAKDVQKEVNKSTDNVNLKIKRNDKIFNVSVSPVKAKTDGIYKLGVWVKDKTAGIGTLTFYDPDTKRFGALGHGITDAETGTVYPVAEGELVNSKVQSVKQGKAGEPGEIRGIFYEAEFPLGELYSNTTYGVFGKTYTEISNNCFEKPMAVGTRDTVKLGKAYILTTLKDNKIEMFEIEIEEINYQREADTKSMTLCVTDKDLLKRCGGIVQGMSGSPIIQNGRIIGAVTHVFVNNPQKGYGIFIEWMLEESEKIK